VVAKQDLDKGFDPTLKTVKKRVKCQKIHIFRHTSRQSMQTIPGNSYTTGRVSFLLDRRPTKVKLNPPPINVLFTFRIEKDSVETYSKI
jgi:hypothetical protein